MKFHSVLLTGFAVGLLSMSAYAGDAAKAPETTEVKEAPVKKVKPHSHMEEKTGVSQPTGETKKSANPEAAAPPKDTHYHPRDGK